MTVDTLTSLQTITPLSDATRDRRVRLLILEQHRLVADALEAIFTREPDILVVGKMPWEAGSAKRVLELRPDIVIIDFRRNDGGAVDAAAALFRAGSEARIIFFAGDESDIVLYAALEAGASALVYESESAEEVIRTVRFVASGRYVIDSGKIARLLDQRDHVNDIHRRLTRRETEVLELMARGAGNREIASSLGIAYYTVRTHQRNLGVKLAAHSKLEVLAKAYERHLVGEWAVTQSGSTRRRIA